MSTFVSVGNATQPFQRLLDAVAAMIDRLPQPVTVQYGSGRFAATGCDARAFIPMDEFERLVAGAELLILHAGAGSVMHALRAGKVPVVMPRRAAFGELVDDHQAEFAEALGRAGRVVVVREADALLAGADRALALQRESRAASGSSEMLRLIGATLDRYARQGER
jgi:UDP-N-acetylglucosamine transferase subunit ALG13